MIEPNETQVESKNTSEVATFIAGGGVLTSGIAVAGTTAIGIGLLPVAALGMVVGLAAYGVKRALFDGEKSLQAGDSSPESTVTGQDGNTADPSQMSTDV